MTNNPRAFPSNAIDPEYGGMSLRDYFAGQALCGLLASARTYGGEYSNRDKVAADAYAHADAMLAERAKPIP